MTSLAGPTFTGSAIDQPTANKPARRTWRAAWWRWRARNPESLTVAIAVVAWIVMAAVHWSGHGDDTAASLAPPRGFARELVLWSAMTMAMMLPGTVGMMRRLALDSLFARRQRSIGIFTATYVGIWTLVAAALLTVERLVHLGAPDLALRTPAALVVSLVGATAWQTTSVKARLLNACHLRTPLAPRGRAADRSVARYALVHARACVGSCWLVMLAMFIAGHDFHLMVPLAALTTYERFVKRPNHTAVAAALFILAAMTALGVT